MFTDDIVLLADTEKGLWNHQTDWKNSIQQLIGTYPSILKKLKYVVIFNKPSYLQLPILCSYTIPQVKEYKYLGIMLLDKSLFKETPKVLAKQAFINKALFSLMKKLSNLSYPKPSLMCCLYDMLTKPCSYVLWFRTLLQPCNRQ